MRGRPAGGTRALAVALLLAVPASAEPPSGSYRGLIGPTATDCDTPERYQENEEVEMVLRVEGDRVTGHYFYTNLLDVRGPDIVIEGRIAPDGTLDLADGGDAKHRPGRWRGEVVVDFHGTWTATAGRKPVPFHLQPLPDDEDEERELAPGIAIRSSRVVGTNLVLPFLTRHPMPDVMAKINDQIRDSFEGHRCIPDSPFPAWPDDYGVDWDVTYASPEVWSVRLSEGWFCGGAYPGGRDGSFTFDLETGEEIGFEGLFRDWERDGAAILELLFGESLRSAGTECKEAAAASGVEELAPGLRFLGGVFAYHLTPTSLHVAEQDLPNVVGACAVQADVPYEKLRQHAAPGGAIARILGARASAKP